MGAQKQNQQIQQYSKYNVLCLLKQPVCNVTSESNEVSGIDPNFTLIRDLMFEVSRTDILYDVVLRFIIGEGIDVSWRLTARLTASWPALSRGEVQRVVLTAGVLLQEDGVDPTGLVVVLTAAPPTHLVVLGTAGSLEFLLTNLAQELQRVLYHYV